MRPAVSPRMFGNIETLHPTYGQILGEDGRRYFFMPSYVQGSVDFVDLRKGMRCSFLIEIHPRGLRATGIYLVESRESTEPVTHAETERESTSR